MAIVIQKHRLHPIWKFYDEKKAYLGQILGNTKEEMPTLAKKISELLLGGKDVKYIKSLLDDKSLVITNAYTNKRVASIEKDFAIIGKVIKNNL